MVYFFTVVYVTYLPYKYVNAIFPINFPRVIQIINLNALYFSYSKHIDAIDYLLCRFEWAGFPVTINIITFQYDKSHLLFFYVYIFGFVDAGGFHGSHMH